MATIPAVLFPPAWLFALGRHCLKACPSLAEGTFLAIAADIVAIGQCKSVVIADVGTALGARNYLAMACHITDVANNFCLVFHHVKEYT